MVILLFFYFLVPYLFSFSEESEFDSHELVVAKCMSAANILIKLHYVKAFYALNISHILHIFESQNDSE